MKDGVSIYRARFIILITLIYFLLALPFHLKPDNFIVDDGYFYPQIARNIASGYGSTFNRVMTTNGYHPLWMLICVGFAFFFKSATALIQSLGLLLDLLVLTAIYFFIYICNASKSYGATAGVSVLIFMTTTLGIWRMLEADLSLALQLAILALIFRVEAKGKDLTLLQSILAAGLFGLALLARLDLIFFVIVVYMHILLYMSRLSWPDRRYLWVPKALTMGTGCCIMVSPYLYWNYHNFGHLEPISGAIKSGFHLAGGFPLYGIPVIVASFLNVARFAKQQPSPFRTIILIASGSSVFHLMYSCIFGSLSAWYLTTGYLSAALCATWLFDLLLVKSRFPMRQIRWSGLFFASVLLSLGTLRLVSNFTYTRLRIGTVRFSNDYIEPKRALADKLRAMLPEGTRIYIFDAPGGVAYYSGMSVIPTDGLVGDYKYSDMLLTDGISRYMEDENIDYIIGPVLAHGQTYANAFFKATAIEGGEAFEIYAPLYHRSAGTVFVRNVDILGTFDTIVPEAERYFPRIALWRVGH